MSNPSGHLDETAPSLGGSLLSLVDDAGVEHLGYETARRTICLERLNHRLLAQTQRHRRGLHGLRTGSKADEPDALQRLARDRASRREGLLSVRGKTHLIEEVES